MWYKFVFSAAISLIFIACQHSNPGSLKTGVWRGVFINDSAVEIPFNFEVYDSAGKKQIAFINGEERLNINEVVVQQDSIIIRTPLYGTEIRAELNDDKLEGIWSRTLPALTQTMKFSARADESWRFAQKPDSAKFDMEGRWSVLITKPLSGDTTLAVGKFVQDGNEVTGTFMTNFGDYRFLQGQLNGDRLFLSSYSGSVPVLFTATMRDKLSLTEGTTYSGPSSFSEWEGKRDADAMLSDPYSLTKLRDGATSLDFTFPDVNGDMVSIHDDRFKGKVVIVQFLGSWCPNCMDETAFLSSFYDRYKSRGVEVVGLAYERYTDLTKAKKTLSNLIERFNVKYPVLLTGHTPDGVLESIPQLQNFTAFPTTIILNKNGEVVSIHSGFNGPATGSAYLEYIEKFERNVDQLLTSE